MDDLHIIIDNVRELGFAYGKNMLLEEEVEPHLILIYNMLCVARDKGEARSLLLEVCPEETEDAVLFFVAFLELIELNCYVFSYEQDDVYKPLKILLRACRKRPDVTEDDDFVEFMADIALCDSCYGELTGYLVAKEWGFREFWSICPRLFWRLVKQKRIIWLRNLRTAQRWSTNKLFFKELLRRVRKGWSGYAYLLSHMEFTTKVEYKFLFYLLQKKNVPKELLEFWVKRIVQH